MADDFKTAGRSPTTPVDNKKRKELLVESDLLEIQVNNTPGVDDDYVQVKCDCPGRRHRVRCRIRTRKPGSGNVQVVLTNPDGRLRFADETDKTKSLEVPGDGAWTDFEISGEQGSKALNDAVIEAHEATEDGKVLAKKKLTVFWFDEAKIDLTVGGAYGLDGRLITVPDGYAIKHSAQARIRPEGVNCAAPQISVLKIGVMQNDRTVGPGVETIWGSPTISWNPWIAPGTTVTVSAQARVANMLPVVANDTSPASAPLYDQPKDPTANPNSLKPPMGCKDGAPTTSSDAPAADLEDVYEIPAKTASGAVVGTITYSQWRRTLIHGKFLCWVVVFNTSTNEFCTLRQRAWTVEIDTDKGAGQRAAAEASDSPVSIQPVLSPIANELVAAAANRREEPFGTETVTFRK
ncbi:TPA: hypothetical protein QDC55_003570 [Burkholderia cenocepacia]|nr:hypothetical protein [Burkholderia cenocepacia]HDR9813031.1 hypothetical protein [Burkholderia cenocepacia]HDR9820235.1 hypothetical protein [Burkholderia cenocepacia]HDR9829999.1 hypothetical protein [Burkholderia cenocepacia]